MAMEKAIRQPRIVTVYLKTPRAAAGNKTLF
jgi:hypothetical protein